MKCVAVTELFTPQLMKLYWWSWNRVIWDWTNNSITHNKIFWIVTLKLSIRGRFLVPLFLPNASTDCNSMHIFSYLFVLVLSIYWKEFTYCAFPFLKMIHENLHTQFLKYFIYWLKESRWLLIQQKCNS
jgi:hypothetical protein